MDSDRVIPNRQIKEALDTLLAQHLLEAVGEDYYQPHPVVTSYAYERFVEDDEQANNQALLRAHARAAEYYQQLTATAHPSRSQPRGISGMHDLIEAVWHRCKAEQWQRAYEILRQEGMFSNLQRWGGNTNLLELYELLLPSDKWQPEARQTAHIYNELGEIYSILGQKERARQFLEQALLIFQEREERGGQINTLNNLGEVCSALGQKEQARSYYQQAWNICQELEDFRGKGTTLNNLGKIYHDLGRKEEALRSYEQALLLHGEEGYPTEKAATLDNLGKFYYDQGKKEDALNYYRQALHIFREEGDRRGEATTLNNLGKLFRELGKKEEALKYYQRALGIFREIGDRWREGKTLRNLGWLYLIQKVNDAALACYLLARDIFNELESPDYGKIPKLVIAELRKRVKESEFEVFFTNVEQQASQIVEQALREER